MHNFRHLYENPKDGFIIPEYFEYFWLDFHISLNIEHSDFSSKLCFDIIYASEKDYENLRWAELIINNQTIRRSLEDWRYGFVIYTMPAHGFACIDGELDKGYHIIEFRMKNSPFSEPYIIRKSAILVE